MDSEPEKVFDLGVKYNKPQHSLKTCPHDSMKSNGDVGIEVAAKYFGKQEPYNLKGPAKSVNYSSDDDSDPESSSMSLVALAARHKKETSLFSENTVIVSKLDLPLASAKNEPVSPSDSSSETEDSSLIALMRKCKSKETYVVDGCSDLKVKNHELSNTYSNKFSVKESVNLNHEKLNYNMDEQTLTLRVEEITTKFVAAHFSDDSDSDEHLSLKDLKHAKTVNPESSGSTDDIRQSQPNVKELQNLANYHRHHTKSESDRFSSCAVHPSDSLLKKSLENSVSTSLRSLRGGGHMELKFSPGGSIPGSFKSLNVSNSLNSSLASVAGETTSEWLGSSNDVGNAYSDSDVSMSSDHFENKFGKIQDPRGVKNFPPLYNEKTSEHFPGHTVDGGINLSCALKEAASERNCERLTSESSIEILGEAEEDEEIVTLLDSMKVDEAVEEEKDKKRTLSKSELDESCMIDISHVLKVRVKLGTRKCSSFGKVVCRQWRSLRTPYVKKDKHITSVIPFNFMEPSPDDVIAYAFKRRL